MKNNILWINRYFLVISKSGTSIKAKILQLFLLCVTCIFSNGCLWIASPAYVPPTDKYYYIHNNSNKEIHLELICDGKRTFAIIDSNDGGFFYLSKGESRRWFCIEEIIINNKRFKTITNTSLPQITKNGDAELICFLFANDSLYKLNVNYIKDQEKDLIPDIYSLSLLLKSYIKSNKLHHKINNGDYFINLGNYRGFHLSLHNMQI